MPTMEKANGYLNDALSELRQEYSEWEQEGQAILNRITAVEALMEGTTAHAVSQHNTSGEVLLSISEDKLNQMLEFLRKNPKSRQADIAAKLGFNSGTVSVGLRKLKAQGAVQEAGRNNGSRLWQYVRIPSRA
jgi:predicted HTH transcriptional regulator